MLEKDHTEGHILHLGQKIEDQDQGQTEIYHQPQKEDQGQELER